MCSSFVAHATAATGTARWIVANEADNEAFAMAVVGIGAAWKIASIIAIAIARTGSDDGVA